MKYRILNRNEIIKRGDEALCNDGQWKPITFKGKWTVAMLNMKVKRFFGVPIPNGNTENTIKEHGVRGESWISPYCWEDLRKKSRPQAYFQC